MTSAKLFFNLMKEDTKQRLWVVALHILALFFILPVFGFLLLGNQDNYGYQMTAEQILLRNQELRKNFMMVLGATNPFLAIEIPIAAIVTGINGFSYLFSRQKTDFYHAMPVKREKLFLVSYINGLLMFILPYIVFSLLTFVICGNVYQISSFGDLFGNVVRMMGLYMVIYFAYYSLAILASILVGHVVIAVLAVGMILAYNFGLWLITEGMCRVFFEHYVSKTWNYFLNPVLWQINMNGAIQNWKFAWSSDLTKLLLCGVIASVLALILYHFRKSEAAGMAIAFAPLKPVLRFFISVPVGLASGLLFREMAGSAQDVWFVFGLFVGCFLTHAVLQVIMEFDFKASFKGRRCLALCVCATFLIGCIFWFDLIGYDSWMPKTNQVESAAVSFDSLSGTNKAYLQAQEEAGVSEEDMEWGVSEYLLNHMKLTGDEVETLLQLVEQGIDGSTQENTQDEACYSFTVRYQMKDGRTIERSYYAIGGEKVKQAVCDLCNTSSYKGTVYPILGTDDIDYQIYEYNNSTEAWEVAEVEDSMQETILATYRKELSAFDTKLCFEEAPIGKIAFVKKGMSDAYIASYPIYTSFTETKKLLDSLGISYQVNAEQISQIDIEYYNEKDGLESTKSYTDKEQIKEIMNNIICDDNSDFTGISVITRNYNYDVTLYYNNTKHETNSAYFIQGKIPDFVLKDFGN